MLDAAGLDTTAPVDALDLGGADINGTARHLLPNATWTGLDIQPGPGVDIVADATTWQPDRVFDVVVCTELLEHVQNWRAVLATAHAALRAGGVLVLTCASNGRRPHGARGDMDPAPGEWYGNVDWEDIGDELAHLFTEYQVVFNPNPGDCYAWGRK
ncbi:methyltransferase domain-containing protein [Amycolatopsis sp. NPDC006131]|uniref:class I SAM-dependent methyltransferase n=1 Tax=Amycolatopsis sp. NPDC006131 TaxID=3156731 RepID=UPI0033A10D04